MSNAAFAPVFAAVATLMQSGAPAVVGIDGRCGSGKTTLASLLAEAFHCEVLHLDDFFLPFEQRSPERLREPAGHMDLSRFARQALLPLCAGREAVYRPFICATASFGGETRKPPGALVIAEGSYALHPLLREHYALRVFVTCPPETQRRRILARGGAKALASFEARWIPQEERYFEACQVRHRADICVDTGEAADKIAP